MAIQPTAINAPPTAFVAKDGRLTREAYRFLLSLTRNSNQAGEGNVATDPGSGLAGGGQVSAGISLSIATNGVTNSMIRQSAGTSVIGRAFGSTGNVADIVANADNRVLSRESGQLAFRNFIDGVSIGPTTAAPLVRADVFESTETPAASTATVTHTIPIETATGTMYILLSSTP